MERQKFEDEWKDAFGNAEISPSENIWTNIELDLEKAEGEKMRRRLRGYQLMAAASVIFALCFAGFGAYYLRNYTSPGQVAINHNKDTNINHVKENNGTAISEEISSSGAHENIASNDHQITESEAHNVNDKSSYSNSKRKIPDNKAIASKKSYGGWDSAHDDADDQFIKNGGIVSRNQPADLENVSDNRNSTADKRTEAIVSAPEVTRTDKATDMQETVFVPAKPGLAALLPTQEITFVMPQAEVDPVAVMMAKLQQRELELQTDKKSDRKKKKQLGGEALWTSVAMATGNFTAMNSSASSLDAALDNSTAASAPSYIKVAASNNYNASASKEVANRQSKASGVTYTAGMTIGTRVSERWLVQGGLNYIAQNSSYEASAVTKDGSDSFNLFTIKDATSARTNNEIKPSAPYNVNNSLRFLSIPFQAGYIALKRKLGIQVHTGISTDVFLQSVATAMVNDSEKKVKDGWGNDSPYRTVNFSGLFGTELSYRIGEHYRLALNPGLRYPFGSIYKSQIGVKAMPLTMDVGLKFKYFFR